MRATTPVYDGLGQPAYPGQALLLASCSQCHSEGLRMRRGAPVGLEFDPALVPDSATGPMSIEPARRLLRIQGIIHRNRDLLYGQVAIGQMPPRGFVVSTTGYAYEDGTLLPGLDTGAGREELRNWLACRSPVIERTMPDVQTCTTNDDCAVTRFCNPMNGQCVGVGDVVASRGMMLDPQWSSLYPTLRMRCVDGCHDATTRFGGLDLSTQEVAYTSVVGQSPGPMTVSCAGQGAYVTAGMPDASLLLSKLSETPACGSRMPIGGTLPESYTDVMREWIMLGAMND